MVFLFWKTKIYSDGVPRETGDYQAVVADSLEDALSKMARFHPNAAISQSYPNPGIIIPPTTPRAASIGWFCRPNSEEV
ncbi:hypothetical protein TPY_2703 [Sulfobacillus acidophilus TPY]|uniref:Uncharacterized protein n=1 Tax=Sulfobacillus acidophilus (strain ATCC 700253 / DSM 10332 / NAL) TaxID=679936 RepID=G8TUM9_SULAD|nr:hypothetical protein TPY_2703 [Sulfobacillus acidophilus TPY]AEW04676.1 hypothetical protein Sulac_1176 [Sulfobacillus acidophilus DSM 10332]